jgi:GTP cyclohydrolase IA
MNEQNAKDAVVTILKFIGEDPTREGLLDTPKRVVKAYSELFKGYTQDPKEILSRQFTDGYDEMVILKDIEFYSFCEHHMLPFFGKVSIAYIPKGKVVGISKLARLVEVYSRRLQIQEKMTDQIAQAIYQELDAKGVGVYVKAKHFCMIARGIQKQNSEMVTNAVLGRFRKSQATREEFLKLIE